MKMRSLHAVPALILACAPLMGADVQSFAGHGTAVAEKSTFGQAKENQKALDKAQQVAIQDALQQALVKSMGVGQIDQAKIVSLAKDLADHSSTFVKSQDITESRMDGLNGPRPISWCKSSGEAGSVGWERSLQ